MTRGGSAAGSGRWRIRPGVSSRSVGAHGTAGSAARGRRGATGSEGYDDLSRLIEAEYAREVLRVAMGRIRGRVEPHTWEAFRLLNVEGLSGKATAARLGMRLGSAYAASARVRRLVREDFIRQGTTSP